MKLLETLQFYILRINILRCYFGHDFRNIYTIVAVGGTDDGQYSGKKMCDRCHKIESFGGVSK